MKGGNNFQFRHIHLKKGGGLFTCNPLPPSLIVGRGLKSNLFICLYVYSIRNNKSLMYLEPERNTQEKLKNKHNQNKKIKIKLQIFRILFPQKNLN